MKHERITRLQELAAAKAQLPNTRKPLSAEAQAARERYLAMKALLVPASVLKKYESK